MDLQRNVQSQYLAALGMLQDAVEKCPESLWDDRSFQNVFWRVVYHALFYTHLYLTPQGGEFVRWEKHREEYHRLDPGGDAYSKGEILEYIELIRQLVPQLVANASLEAPSGISWLPFNRLETHFYNIRHLQQHIGELSERLGVTARIDVDWVSQS